MAESSRAQGTTPHGDRGGILRPRGKLWGSELIVQDLLCRLVATHLSLDDWFLISGVLCVFCKINEFNKTTNGGCSPASESSHIGVLCYLSLHSVATGFGEVALTSLNFNFLGLTGMKSVP